MGSDFEYLPPTGQLPGVSFEQQTTAFFENVAAQADSASRAAADAQNTVAEAISAAQAAARAATQAQQAAQQAQNYAQGAQAAATAATQTADSAYALADTAEADAQAAIGGAGAASTAASTAQARADAAYALASQAQAIATSASVDAAKAQNTADVADAHALAASTAASNAATDAAAALAALAGKQDTLVAGANMNITGNVISASVTFPGGSPRAALYINGSSLQDSAPVATTSTAFPLSGNNTTLRSFAFVTPADMQILQSSFYDAWLYLSGLQDTTYTAIATWRYGATIISMGRMLLPIENQNALFFQVPMYVNQLTAPLNVPAFAALNLDLTISKSSGGSHTLTLAASPQYPSGIVRNGGEISANSVYGLWGNQILSQAAINAIVYNFINNLSIFRG